MYIYLLLITVILFFSAMLKMSTGEGRMLVKNVPAEDAILRFGLAMIFLVLALKKYTVGIDIPGYKVQYIMAGRRPWEDVDYVYFETGYIQLTKLFSKANVDFQLFMVFVYGGLCVSLYIFIKKFSKNVTLSLLIFICYQFFVFSISAVRQTIAMALCMIAYTVFIKGRRKDRILAFAITLGAFSIHRSAAIFVVVYILSFIKSPRVHLTYYLLMIPLAFLMRPFCLQMINRYFATDKTASTVTLGGSFIFLVGIALFVWYISQGQQCAEDEETMKDEMNLSTLTRILLASVLANIVLSGSTFLRSVMYLNLFLIPAVPNAIKGVNSRQDRVVLDFAFGVFLLLLFYSDTLAPNQLRLCPYRFYWQ